MAKPLVRRTYGSKVSQNSSSSIFESLSSLYSDAYRSSSPPSSLILASPPPGSPPNWTDDRPRGSSPLFPELSDNLMTEQDDTNVSLEHIDVLGDPLPQEKQAWIGSNVREINKRSTIHGFFAPIPQQKRPLRPATTVSVLIHTSSRPKPSCVPSTSKTAMTQLHLTYLPLLHTCKECSMSFVRGGEDEGLHEKHHARVTRGIVWDGLSRGKGQSREGGWRTVHDAVRFGRDGKGTGKIVVCDGSWGGSKLHDILYTVDTVLSSPPLPAIILDASKVLLFVTSSPPPLVSGKRRRTESGKKQSKERIVGIAIAQGIKWAMRVIRPGEVVEEGVMSVDSGGGIFCDPTSLPTSLGIHRLFTIPAYRSLGLAQILLDAACGHTVYGCSFDPRKGDVAFSQPTESGRVVMERWGRGGVRVFVDDESQL
ncbi:MAG: hypothetical protein TREMPRED_002547 [Tremellales sp. Tagirdzhanova-0007]|nr:MAG: hypothetical protein TREMPRED_002547 [Tremellales sp. Tagirdzhanova-0007]